MLGQHFGPYRIDALLGAGGMGEVYRAHDTRLDRDVALKIVPPGRDIARFRIEAKTLAALNHPNIVTIYDIGETDGQAWFVSELIDGDSLRTLLDAGPLPPRRALDIAIQLADGLAAAHQAKVTHRDLKPENVMVLRDGRAKILDFGLAKLDQAPGVIAATVTDPGIVMGTLGYMSPEQLRAAETDARTDIFSFGAMLYEMLSGQRAFHSPSGAEMISAILKDDPADLPASTPATLQSLVRRCLEKEPARRFQSAADLAFALRSQNSGTAPSQPAAPVRRSRPMMGVALGAAACVATFLATHYWPHDPVPDLSAVTVTPIATEFSRQDNPAWSPDGKFLAYDAVIDGIRQIMVRSLDATTPQQLTHCTRDCLGPMFSPDGLQIYYSYQNAGKKDLWSIATVGGQPSLILLDIGGNQRYATSAISPDGKTFVSCCIGSRLMISSPIGAAPKPYPGWEGTLRGVANLKFSRNGTSIAIALGGVTNSDVWVLPYPPSNTAAPVRLSSVSGSGFVSASWWTDERYLILTSRPALRDPGHLWLADIRKDLLIPISAGHGSYFSSVVSRQGRIAYVTGASAPDIVEIPLDGSPIRPVLATRRMETMPDWSPDGNEFLFVSNRTGKNALWTYSPTTQRYRRLMSTEVNQAFGGKATFSPDGQRILFRTDSNWYIIPAQGGAPVPISSGDSLIVRAAWAPDSQSLVVLINIQQQPASWRLAILPLGSATPRVILEHKAFNPMGVSWSSNGRWIASGFPEGFGVISPDGKQTKILIPGDPGQRFAYGWSRDGGTLYAAHAIDRNYVLTAFDVDSGRSRLLRTFDHNIEFHSNQQYNAHLSISPDGKSLLTSINRDVSDVWIMDGFKLK